MFWTFLKSDLKRELRDKVGLIMIIVFPIILIFILSNAFGSLMNSKFVLSPFSVGYSMSQNSTLGGSMSEIQKSLKDVKISLVKTDKSSALKQISDNKLAGYVEFTDAGYKFYSNDNMSIDSDIFQSVLQSISYSTGTYTEMYKILAQYKTSAPQPTTRSLFTIKKLEAEPFPSALTYYGIVMLINILCFSAVGTSNMIHDDRQLNISQRIALTKVNPFTVFFGRVVSSTLSNILQISAAIICSVLFLKVNYGSSYPLVIGLVLLFSITANSVGIMLGYLLKNISVTRSIIYALSFFLNFLGGSFMQYFHASGSFLSLIQKTPIYYINRSLVEIATRGSSDVLPTALVIMVSTIAVSLLIGGFAFSRREGRLCNN